jgi:hypothetical protein
LYHICAFDLLWRYEDLVVANHEPNPTDIPEQEEISSILQQCEALVDSQIELFGHWESVTWIQDFDSGLVKTGLVIGDILTRWPLCGSLHQQEA